MEVCWEENCKTKDKPICCVECEEKDGCSEYCETCFDKDELRKYETCFGCTDRTQYNEDADEPVVNCHMTCKGYIYRQKQSEETKKKRASEKEYDNFHQQTVRRMKAIQYTRRKGK